MIWGVLQCCHGIVLSKKKLKIGRVHFTGYNITDGGIRPDEERMGLSVNSPHRRRPSNCGAPLASPTS